MGERTLIFKLIKAGEAMAKQPVVKSTKQSIFLFSDLHPKGQMFAFEGGKESEEYKAMLEKGWVDTPAKLNLPEDMDTGISVEVAKAARPEDLKAMLEAYGFIVLTPEQLKAEAVKMATVAMDLGNFSDEDLIAEAERRGLKEPDQDVEEADASGDQIDSLLEKFNVDPKSLTVAELITLGNTKFDLKLRSNTREDTAIERITAAMNG